LTRSFALLLALAVTLIGCGSNSTSTGTATKLFTDAKYHFSFRYPAQWVPHPGAIEQLNSVSTYVVRISVPNNTAGPEVTMSGTVTPFGNFPNGEIKVDPNVGPGKFQYFHLKLSGRDGMQVRHFISGNLREIQTFVESAHRLYDARIVVPNPPISRELQAEYNTITSTLKIPSV
jgi:hypothetical protein